MMRTMRMMLMMMMMMTIKITLTTLAATTKKDILNPLPCIFAKVSQHQQLKSIVDKTILKDKQD
jgi:hypothetical protein